MKPGIKSILLVEDDHHALGRKVPSAFVRLFQV